MPAFLWTIFFIFISATNVTTLKPTWYTKCNTEFCIGIKGDDTSVAKGGCLEKKDCEFLFHIEKLSVGYKFHIYVSFGSKPKHGAWARVFFLKEKLGMDDVPDMVPYSTIYDVNLNREEGKTYINYNGKLNEWPFMRLQSNFTLTNMIPNPQVMFEDYQGKILIGSATFNEGRCTIKNDETNQTVYDVDFMNDNVYPYISYHQKRYEDNGSQFTVVNSVFLSTDEAVNLTRRSSYEKATFGVKKDGKDNKESKFGSNQSNGWLVVLCIIIGLVIVFMVVNCFVNGSKAGHSALADKKTTTTEAAGTTATAPAPKDAKSKGVTTNDVNKKVEPSHGKDDVKVKTETKAEK